MNDQHPHAGHVGYDSQLTGSFDTDPLFGSLQGGHETGHGASYAAPGYDTGSYAAPDTAYAAAQPAHGDAYDSSWDTGAQQTAVYDGGYPQQPPASHQWDTTGTWQQSTDQDPTGQWPTADTGAFPTTGLPTTGLPTTGLPTTGLPTTELPGDATDAYGTAVYGTGTYGAGSYDTGTYDTTTTNAFATGTAYGTGGYDTGTYDTGSYDTGTYDTTAVADTGSYATTAFATGTYGNGVFDTGSYDTGAYDATAWNSGATPGDAAYEHEHTSYPLYEQRTADAAPPQSEPGAAEHTERTAQDGPAPLADVAATAEFSVLEPDAGAGPDSGAGSRTDSVPRGGDGTPGSPAAHALDRTAVHAPASRNRARRRSPAKRSALLTVAVPSACVMSVAGIAAASVSGIGGGEDKPEETTASLAVADPATVKAVAANNKLDSQLAQLSEGSDDFRERASRTQERIDLRERQAMEKKKREEEAARREALRPKFVLPVKQHGLSAYYGQAGVNWMSAHSGIDFPVSYGTPVMSATDGTVRTQLNSAYGVMAIVTAADGTETWYCHLSSNKVRSGPVKAGDVIAYSGNSGNSTGPHLHFEVRPGGGAPIDPLAWLRSKGVDPT